MSGIRKQARIYWSIWQSAYQGASVIDTLQHKRLDELVQFARLHSPFYREFYSHLPARIPDLRSLSPVTKSQLMASFDDWVTNPAVTRAAVEAFIADKERMNQLYLDQYFVGTTSGTTGQRGILLHDPDAMLVYRALGLRMLTPRMFTLRNPWTMLRTGIRAAMVMDTSGHSVSFSSITTMMKVKNKNYPWLKAPFKRLCILPMASPLPEIVQGLNEFQPMLLFGYPSIIGLLAKEQIAHRLRIKPFLIYTGSETSSFEERERIGKAFNCLVRDIYGAAEYTNLAFDCGHGSLHVNSDWAILEPVDEKYKPVPIGQPSHSLLLTNLANHIQPVIRYDLGDSITLCSDPCTCGSPFPALHVVGRKNDILRFQARDGGAIPIHPLPLARIAEAIPGVQSFQAIQVAPNTLRVRLAFLPGENEVQIRDIVSQTIREYIEAQGASSICIDHASEQPMRDPTSGKFRRAWVELKAAKAESDPKVIGRDLKDSKM